MKLTADQWDIKHLRAHLQYAVDLEVWTIPFYMSAMYSIQDRTHEAYQLIRTVLNQEMLHVQSAANVANVYGLSPCFGPPAYEGTTVPHLDFSGDAPEEVDKFKPYTAEIGSLDLEHINAMCLIEIPENLTGETPDLHDDVNEYGSIGQFYQAVAYGAAQLKGHLRGGVNQVDYFSAFYRNAPSLKVTDSGEEGFSQASLLIDLITDQGEGDSKQDQTILPAFWNTADDVKPEADHFGKFVSIKDTYFSAGGKRPVTFATTTPADYTQQQKDLEAILIDKFTELRKTLEALFSGRNPPEFFPIMAAVGGAIRNCWEHGVTPKFS